MKKLLFVLAIAATVAACNNSTGDAATTDTAAAPTADTLAPAPTVVDTSATVPADTTKVDTTKH